MNEAAEQTQQPPTEAPITEPSLTESATTDNLEVTQPAAVDLDPAAKAAEEEKIAEENKPVNIEKLFAAAGARIPKDGDDTPKAQKERAIFQRFQEKNGLQVQGMLKIQLERRTESADKIAFLLHPDAADQTGESKILRPDFGNFNPDQAAAESQTDATEEVAEADEIQDESQETAETSETTLAAERQKTTQLLQDTLRLNELQQLQDSITDLGENATEEQIQAVFEQVVADTVLNRVTYELSSLQKPGEPKQVIGEAEQKLAALWVKDRLKNDGNSEGNIAERSMGVISVVTELHDLIDEEETVLQKLAADKGEEGEAILQYFNAKKQILLRPWVEASTQDKYDQMIAEMLASEVDADDEDTTQESTEEGEDFDEGDLESELAMPKFEEGQKGYWKQYLIETLENSNRANSSDRFLSALFGDARGKVGGNEFASSYGYEAPQGHEPKSKSDFLEAARGPKSTKMAEAVLDAMTNSGGVPGLESANIAQASEIKALLQSAKDGSEPGSMAKALEMILDQTMRGNGSNKAQLLEIFMTKVPTALFGSQAKFAFDDTVLGYFHQEYIAQADPSKRWSELDWDTSDKLGSQPGEETATTDTSQEAAAA